MRFAGSPSFHSQEPAGTVSYVMIRQIFEEMNRKSEHTIQYTNFCPLTSSNTCRVNFLKKG